MTTLFISDLHLSPAHPEITDCFLRFMSGEALDCDALYVLGDLFEAWIGDDDDTPLHRQVIDAFKTLTSTGIPVYFVHGNRDFLVGKRFATLSGVTLLPESHVIDLYGTPTLIMHGDTLCTQDIDYQNYRKKVHNPVIQWFYFLLPLFIRRKIGEKMRAGSEKQNSNKNLEIMDVDGLAVEQQMAQHNVLQLIHGHTHRPAIHPMTVSGQPAHRIVLGDWYSHGSVLVYNQERADLQTRNLNVA